MMLKWSWTDWQPPQLPAYDPAQGDPGRDVGLYPSDIEQKPEGYKASPADAPDKLKAQGWWQCPTQRNPADKNRSCGFWLSPQAHQAIAQSSGYFMCPRCKQNHNLMEELPWHGVDDPEVFGIDSRNPSGGGTRIGIPMTDQGQIGENLVTQMGEIPGYGPITWWHPGGAGAQSPLDGMTKEWGIEVKTIGADAANHRFAPGGEGGKAQTPQAYKMEKDQAARDMGLRGVLGLLVILDYRRDVADIYLKPMPLDPWETSKGQFTQGVAQFRKNTAQKLLAEVPFQSPYKDPNNPSPGPYYAEQYYNKPQMQLPDHLRTHDEPDEEDAFLAG